MAVKGERHVTPPGIGISRLERGIGGTEGVD